MSTQIMGILNITEDSFSDGGRYLHLDAALAHARELIAAGADIIDVGGESTRPGATRVPEDLEHARVVPVIRALSEMGVTCSVDTMRASVAEAALAAGATIINDVSGAQADPAMLGVMAASDARCCLMHWDTERFGDAAGTSQAAVPDVLGRLLSLAREAEAAGVARERIIIDPGLGFAKTAEDNWALLAALPAFVATGYPVLVGASRKRFLNALSGSRVDVATATVSALAAAHGAWCVRVHDVAATHAALAVARAWKEHEWTA